MQKVFLGLVCLVILGVAGLTFVKIPAPSIQVRKPIDVDQILQSTVSLAQEAEHSI